MVAKNEDKTTQRSRYPIQIANKYFSGRRVSLTIYLPTDYPDYQEQKKSKKIVPSSEKLVGENTQLN
jgi:hypothetical protein